MVSPRASANIWFYHGFTKNGQKCNMKYETKKSGFSSTASKPGKQAQ